MADYEYVHYCYKYNMDVKLALIHRYNFVLNIFVLFLSCQTYVSTVDMSTVELTHFETHVWQAKKFDRFIVDSFQGVDKF